MPSALICSVSKIDLTKNIPNILNDLQDEVGYAVGTHIGNVPGMNAIADLWVQRSGLNCWDRLDAASIVPHAEPLGCFTVKPGICWVSS